MNDIEMYDDLCAAMEGQETSEVFGAVGEGEKDFGISPVVLVIFKTWIWAQLRRVTCENKQAIAVTATRWINQYVKNDSLALVLGNVLTAILETACPDVQ